MSDAENTTAKRKRDQGIENYNGNSSGDVSRSKSNPAGGKKARLPLTALPVNSPSGDSTVLLCSPASESSSTSSDEGAGDWVHFDNLSCCAALRGDVWEEMRSADLRAKERVDPSYFSRHPTLLPHYRAILLDWLLEISDLYKLSRDTFYLTVDFLDRYLTRADGYPREKLQMLGVTCLMIASKIEEVKPIPLADLLYLSDNSCTSEEVIQSEREVLESLDWTRTLWTSNRWLFLYLHMVGDRVDPETFSLVTKLLDLSTLDVDSLNFSYRVLAATSLRLASVDIPFELGPDFDVTACSVWMSPYWEVIRNNSVDSSGCFSSSSSNHCRVFSNINLCQKYTTFMSLYEEARDLIELQRSLPSSPLSVEEF